MAQQANILRALMLGMQGAFGDYVRAQLQGDGTGGPLTPHPDDLRSPFQRAQASTVAPSGSTPPGGWHDPVASATYINDPTRQITFNPLDEQPPVIRAVNNDPLGMLVRYLLNPPSQPERELAMPSLPTRRRPQGGN